MRTTPQAATLLKCIQEAKRFIELAEEVPLTDFGRDLKGKKVQFIESGKASGAARRASMDLTRALADYRSGR
jgi:hypothetical protein